VTHEVSGEEFEELVADAVSGLPEQFIKRLSNVEFSVEPHARPEDYGRMGLPRGSVLLGVYRGVPLTRRGHGYNMAVPDRIVIFQAPIERLARDADDLRERVQHVVRHEVAHYFGISDERLRELEAY
jgi:predicted Zn-dependent protease with MMP-like domain